jgi:hypothetical protein
VIIGSSLTPFFLAVQEATEEAVYNSFLRAETVCGMGGRCEEAIDIGLVLSICRKYGVLKLTDRLPGVNIQERDN